VHLGRLLIADHDQSAPGPGGEVARRRRDQPAGATRSRGPASNPGARSTRRPSLARGAQERRGQGWPPRRRAPGAGGRRGCRSEWTRLGHVESAHVPARRSEPARRAKSRAHPAVPGKPARKSESSATTTSASRSRAGLERAAEGEPRALVGGAAREEASGRRSGARDGAPAHAGHERAHDRRALRPEQEPETGPARAPAGQEIGPGGARAGQVPDLRLARGDPDRTSSHSEACSMGRSRLAGRMAGFPRS